LTLDEWAKERTDRVRISAIPQIEHHMELAAV
jgi:hypothetical protein